MPTPELWLICVMAFSAVALLLAILAGIMRLILTIFPYKEETADAMMIAAVASVVTSIIPGARITKVEEIQ